MPLAPNTYSHSPTAWLNGVRGIAALIVAFVHFIAGEVDPPFRAFSAEPMEENRRIYQLPPFRILFADQAMVALFFVVSAYSISIAPLKARETASRGTFLNRLASSVFRRPIRLYVPVTVLELISHAAYFLGLYKWSTLPDEKLDSFGDHVVHFGGYMLHLMNPFIPVKIALNIQVWTIPAEFKGSCFVFLTLIATANLRPLARLSSIFFVALLAVWHLNWLLFTFLSGLAIAEIQLMQDMRQPDAATSTKPAKKSGKKINGFLFILGFYLLCIPEHPAEYPWGYEYGFLGALGSALPEAQERKAQMWRSIGGVMCMFATSRSSMLQAPFNTAIAQYLGKISFGLYLVHVMIYALLRNTLIHFFWFMIG